MIIFTFSDKTCWLSRMSWWVHERYPYTHPANILGSFQETEVLKRQQNLVTVNVTHLSPLVSNTNAKNLTVCFCSHTNAFPLWGVRLGGERGKFPYLQNCIMENDNNSFKKNAFLLYHCMDLLHTLCLVNPNSFQKWLRLLTSLIRNYSTERNNFFYNHRNHKNHIC